LRAKAQIEHTEVDLITKIVQEGLDSASAKEFIENMPTVEQLMPQLSLSTVETKVQRKDRQLEYE
jgi:hypothetical protein